jgi:hypothetical protein
MPYLLLARNNMPYVALFVFFSSGQKADQISWGDSIKNFQIFTQVHQGGRVCKAICGNTASVFGKENTRLW